MNILALESAAKAAGAAVLCDGKLVAEQFTNNGLTHSCTLMEMADAALSAAGMGVDKIDIIAVDAGPGSFTGIRIGLGTAKGLALGAEKPIVCVSSLLGLAMNAAGTEGTVVPLMDARRGEVYTATYEMEKGIPREIVPMRAVPLRTVLTELKEATFVGDGAEVHRDLILEIMGDRARFMPPHLLHQRAASIGVAAQFEKTVSVHDAAPIYLRLPQAEREWNEKNNQGGNHACNR